MLKLIEQEANCDLPTAMLLVKDNYFITADTEEGMDHLWVTNWYFGDIGVSEAAV